LTLAPLVARRLRRQQVLRPRLTRPDELVKWMGAVQAQEYLGGLWAVGLRLDGGTESDVEAAIAARTIVRTWPMRGTLHFVPAADARWMVSLLAPRMIARAAGRYRELELDDGVFGRSRDIVMRALEGGKRLTRPELYAALERGGISPAGQRGIHIIGHLAQQALLCCGPRRERQPTFVRLDEWLPVAKPIARAQALVTLATRYFASHGPATSQDFAWWSGLTVKEAQAAIEDAGSRLEREGPLIEAPPAPARIRSSTTIAALLPPWDEYVVAYKDRDAVDHARGRANPLATVGRPLILINGRVAGSWRRTLAPTSVQVSLELWSRVGREERRAIEAAAACYGAFLDKEAQVRTQRP
jgi:hypothetical protein